MLVIVLIYTILKKDLGSLYKQEVLSKKSMLLFAAAVISLSFYDGFFGPGTGSFLIFIFIFLGYDFVKASANSKLFNFVSNTRSTYDVFNFRGSKFYIRPNYGRSKGDWRLVWDEICIKQRH